MANGDCRWHASNFLMIHDADGRIANFLGIARDIKERKQ